MLCFLKSHKVLYTLKPHQVAHNRLLTSNGRADVRLVPFIVVEEVQRHASVTNAAECQKLVQL